MRALVTGAAGFVGRHVVAALLRRGIDVVALARRPVDHAPGARGVALDLARREDVRALVARERPDAIVHLAWYAHPGDYVESPANLECIAPAAALALAAAEAGCRRLVVGGSCLEYVPGAPGRPSREGDAVSPAPSLYAACKDAAHVLCRRAVRGGATELAWARLFFMHGPGEHPSRLVPSIAARLRDGREIDLTPGEQLRDTLRVEDAAEALAVLATAAAADGAFNVCSGVPLRLRDLAEAVARACARPELLRFGARPYAANDRMYLVGDPGRLRSLGWAPRHRDLDESVAYLASRR